MKNKRGFSLVELLAVITLLGLIILIAIPSYDKYIAKTEDRLFDSYERNLEDAAKTYLTKCFFKNKCEDQTLTYTSILGTRKLDINKLNVELEKCLNPSGYVAIVEDEAFTESAETEIDKYKFVTCLKCDGYESESCKNITNNIETSEHEKIELVDKNQYEQNPSCNIKYTNQSQYKLLIDYDDIVVNIKEFEEEKNFCYGKECLFDEEYYNKEIELFDKYKGAKGCIKIIKDTTKPTLEIISVSDMKKWTKDKEIEIKLYDDIAIDLDTLTLINKDTSNELSLYASTLSFKTKIEANEEKNGKYKICVNDKAHNEVCLDFELKITNKNPSISITPNNIYQQTQLFSVIPGEDGMEAINNLEIMVSDKDNPLISELEELESKSFINNNYTIKPKSSGNKYIFIKEFENEAGISSVKDNNYIEINNIKYHRYGPVMIDVTPPTCKIEAKFNGIIVKEEDEVKYPELELVPSYSDELSEIKSYSWKALGGKGSLYITENDKYTYEVEDEANNIIQCSYDTTKKNQLSNSEFISGNFTYNGQKESPIGVNGWIDYAVDLGVDIKSGSDAPLSSYKYEDNVSVDINAQNFKTNVLDKFEKTGVYSAKKLWVTIKNSSTIFTKRFLSMEIKIDVTKPYTPYISDFAETEKNMKNVKKISASSECFAKEKTGNINCTIEYTDPNEISTLYFSNPKYAVLPLSIASLDEGSGISGYLYSNDKIKWNTTNKNTIQNEINKLTEEIGWGDNNAVTIHLKSKDYLGHESAVLSITFIRRLV